jgi:hypothetical protein
MNDMDWLDIVTEDDEELRRRLEEEILEKEVETRGLRKMTLAQERDFFNGLLDEANEAVDFFEDE